MRRLIVTAFFCTIASCAVFVFSPFTISSNAQDGGGQQPIAPATEQKTGKKMPIDKTGIRRLKQNTGESASVSINEATGAAAFVRLTNNKSRDLSRQTTEDGAMEKSVDFFREYGSLFGIKNPDEELRLDQETGAKNDQKNGEITGERHQSFQQFYKGIPVFAGMLKTHLDKESRLYAVNGTFVPEIEIDVNPVFSQAEAEAAAVSKIFAEKSADGLFAAKSELCVYRTGLIKGVPGSDFLTWQIEVTNNSDVREFVFIDAHTNKFVDGFTGIHDALARRAYDGLSLQTVPPNYPAVPFWTEGQAFPTASAEANNMLLASKETYDMFKNAFNRDSYDGAGAVMDSIFNRGYSCPNASWNGTFISFCAGLTTDDITAHEWGHAYTQFTHNLIYQWQPGALNESYSDIYGEIIDRLNNRDTVGNSATDAARSPGVCNGSTRWRMGEDATGGINGAIRDMYNPNCFGDAGKVSDAAYFCGGGDSGGVHSNSGVPNHAFALLADGGAYNGQTINAIGLTKAAHIYFRAMNVYQQKDSDFSDHADALEQSADDLKNAGTNLADLQTGLPSGLAITTADIAEVRKAILAVQLRTPPTQCNFVPLLAKNPPAETSCGTGTVRGAIFADDFESGASGWSVGKVDTLASFYLPDWSLTTDLPDNIPGKGFFGAAPSAGSCQAADNQKGVRFLKSPMIQIPADTLTNPILSFDHWIALESGYDGAQLQISVNGGAFTLVPQSNFIYNAHTTTLINAPGNDNPRASQFAWTGADGGAVSGSWGKTMVNLTGLVSPGNTVQFRWDLSTDICDGTFGWYVDNVKVTACLPAVSDSFEGDLSPRPNGNGSIQSDDIVQVQRFQIGLDQPNPSGDEFQRADSAPFATRGDGLIQANDVVQAQRFQIGLDLKQNSGGPLTVGSNASLTNQSAVRSTKTVSKKRTKIAVRQRGMRVESVSSNPGRKVFNIRADTLGDESGFGFQLDYNQSTLLDPLVTIGTSGGSKYCNTTVPGRIICSISNFSGENAATATDQIGEIAAGGSQMLVQITFAAAANASVNELTLELSNVNASNDAAQNLTIVAADGSTAIVAERKAKSDFTNPFSYYKFDAATTGKMYSVFDFLAFE